MKPSACLCLAVMLSLGACTPPQSATPGRPNVLSAADVAKQPMPTVHEEAKLTYAPEVPPPITRRTSAIVDVAMEAGVTELQLGPSQTYSYWTFNKHTPGPFIRARVGDTLHFTITNSDASGMPHNVDFHAVTGPGGGAPIDTVVQGDETQAWFRLLVPGFYVYHCAAPPVMDHIANGMYGVILVEPAEGMPKVDHEYYVMQSEVYTKQPLDFEGHLDFSHQAGLAEHPTFVLFNGARGALVGDGALKAKTGERVRVYFGNIGPNLISSFHIIGTIFDQVHREGGLTDPPEHGLQTTVVPSGGATIVEVVPLVPGNYTLVDHAIFRIEKGAVGFLTVTGDPRPDIYLSKGDSEGCTGCLSSP